MPILRLIFGLLLSGAALALAGCTEGADQAKAQGVPQGPPPVTVATPLQRQIVDWDEYSGHFRAAESVEVRPRVTGYLTAVNFRDGQLVRRGDVLFAIDPRPFQAELARARAEEAKARSGLMLARRELDRVRPLLKRGFITRREFDEREAAVASASAAVAAAQAAIRARALDVEYATVRAPITGRVSDSRVDRGNLVTGGGQGEPTLLTTIMSVDPIQFELQGSESVYLKYSRANQAGTRTSSRYASNPVEIRLQDDPSYTIRGRMDFVDNALDTGSDTIRPSSSSSCCSPSNMKA